MNEKSILGTIKKLLGIGEDYTEFDTDIILNINSVFSILTQMNVGPEAGFRIEDDSAIWNDFVSDSQLLELVVSFMYLRVRLLFDPPSSSFVLTSMQDQIDELTWRIFVIVDPELEIEDEGRRSRHGYVHS